MMNSSQTPPGGPQTADREVFREVLAALRRCEALQTELARVAPHTSKVAEEPAGIAIEPARIDEALQRSEGRLRQAYGQLAQVQRLSHTGSFTTDIEADEHVWSDELYRIAQRLSKTGSFTWDLKTNERRWSEEMYRIFEIEPGAPVSSALARKRVHPDDLPAIDALVPRAEQGKDLDLEFRLIMPRGALKRVHLVGNRLDEARERPVFVGAVQDVTDRKVAEEGLARARSELAHVARAMALSALTASIAHEVNQPLVGIIANASTCLRMLAADPPNIEGAKATTQRTIRDSNRASEVIMRLRSLFARKPAGKEPLDLNAAAQEILMLSSSELQNGRVVLQTDFALDLPAVLGDRIQLQQVILNLVLNAAQAMRGIDGRPRDLRVSTARFEADQVTLSVRDSGVGAAAEDLEQLFNAFYTTKPDGMGVGLSISQAIIEAHGGRLWARANDGPGLTVSFSIPISTVEAGPH